MMGIGRGRRRQEREMLGTAEGAATSSPAEGGGREREGKSELVHE